MSGAADAPDGDGTVAYANRAARELLGLAVDLASGEGHDLPDTSLAELSPPLAALLRRSLRGDLAGASTTG